jgi:hypothetical protein
LYKWKLFFKQPDIFFRDVYIIEKRTRIYFGEFFEIPDKMGLIIKISIQG